MASLARRIAPLVAGVFTSARLRDLRRWRAERARRRAGEPHRVHYFHQVDDPYAQLAAQVLLPLCARYDVELVPHLVGPPSDAAAPERARLEEFSRRDAADVAPGYGLRFPAHAAAPDAKLVAQAQGVLVAALAKGRFAEAAARIGEALYSADAAALDALARELGCAEPVAVAAALEEGNRLREQRGHYLGATFLYAGEWYWGVDRLEHLERRLAGLGALRPGQSAAPLAPRPTPLALGAPSTPSGVALEFYASLRSPYTYIAMERSYALARRYGVPLVLRPVLPMVMRGLPVPPAKRMYITLDTKREAEVAGIRFGRVCDPVGRPVERGFSLYALACERGRGAEYLLSFARAAFAEGVDTGSDAGLRFVAERAGLDWSEARAQLDREGWREALEANREALFALGLWGVPSFVLTRDGRPLFSTWGQDRLWRVEQELQRKLGLTP